MELSSANFVRRFGDEKGHCKICNAPPHAAISVHQFLAKNNMTHLPHASYSPDHALCDFFLFLRMKRDMKGQRFDDVEAVKKKTRQELSAITTDEFKKCFQEWDRRLDKCIMCNGEYFEGDKVVL